MGKVLVIQRLAALVRIALAVLIMGAAAAFGEPEAFDPPWGTEVDAALAEFEIGNSDGAVEQLIPLADAGDVHAQFLLGRFYEDEMEFKVNHCRALHWYKEAAAQGHAAATTATGYFYLSGYCRHKDYDEAAGYFERAVILGDASAALMLTYLHLAIDSGHFDPQSTVKRAETAWDLSQESKRPDWVAINAATVLGRVYGRGYGVSKDSMKAEHFLRVAAEQGSPDAQYQLGEFYRDRYGHPRYRESWMWLSLAAHQGDRSAVDQIAHLSDQTRAEARRTAMAMFEKMIEDPQLAIGRAAKWCLDHQTNAELCLRFAYRDHFECDPLIASGYFEARYVNSRAYDLCRKLAYDVHVTERRQ